MEIVVISILTRVMVLSSNSLSICRTLPSGNFITDFSFPPSRLKVTLVTISSGVLKSFSTPRVMVWLMISWSPKVTKYWMEPSPLSLKEVRDSDCFSRFRVLSVTAESLTVCGLVMKCLEISFFFVNVVTQLYSFINPSC